MVDTTTRSFSINSPFCAAAVHGNPPSAEMLHHTYMNDGGIKPEDHFSTETKDLDFLTDANVYYNLPPPLPCAGHTRGGASSLPRGTHFVPPAQNPQHQTTRTSSSCPASPKLPPITAVSLARSKGNNCSDAPPPPQPPPRPPASLEKGPGGLRPDQLQTTSPPLKQRMPSKLRNKKLSHTRSFDLDHIYQNLVRVASKPRSNSFSIDLPWRRKKKVAAGQSATAAAPDIKEDYAEVITTPAASQPLEGNNRCEGDTSNSPPVPRPVETLGSGTSVTSNSSSSNSDSSSESDCGAGASLDPDVCPGVTYLRKVTSRCPAPAVHEDLLVVNSWYHTAATLPLRSGNNKSLTGAQEQECAPPNSEQDRRVLDVNANLDSWLRKERWLEKKRSSRNIRLVGECSPRAVMVTWIRSLKE